jgi:hypothetical protein
VTLQQLPLPDQVANGYGLEVGRLWLAPASRLVPVSLELHQLGERSDQSGDYLSLMVGQALVRDGNGVRRLTIDMGQAIGIADTIATGNRLKAPWSRKAAASHHNALC